MANADGSYERLDNNPRAQDRIKRDATDTVRKVIQGEIDKVAASGFRKEDITPLVKEGAREAIENRS